MYTDFLIMSNLMLQSHSKARFDRRSAIRKNLREPVNERISAIPPTQNLKTGVFPGMGWLRLLEQGFENTFLILQAIHIFANLSDLVLNLSNPVKE
jgi:hypothetical protein